MKPGLRIDSLRVRRFGHFSDYALELGPGLHLLYGPNEAGKSTLLAFLRAMLFGFEKRGHPERYAPPDEDTSSGGELRLLTATGALTVRRMATARGRKSESVTVLGPQGEPLSEERLKEARGHVTRELFFDVFAFRLEELAGFEQLTEERGASEALVAASMRGARRLPEAMALLRKNAELLYKPAGVNPELNVKLRELEEVQEKLRQEGNRPALYFAMRDKQEALGVESRALEARGQEERRELERLERLESALGDVTALAAARAELETLPILGAFPEGGEARLEDVLHRSRGYRAEVARLAERLASTESELERLSVASPVRGREEASRAAVAAFSERSELLRALPARRAALGMKRRQVEAALEELGLDVDGPRLLALDLSAGARAGLESLASRLEVEELGRREAGSALGRARLERERMDDALMRMEVELAGLPEARPAQVRHQQAGLSRMRGVRADLERLGEQKEEARRRLEGLRGQEVEPATPAGVIPLWWVPVAALVAVALAVGAWWLGGFVAGGLGLGGGLVLTGLLELARRRVEAARDTERGTREARQSERRQDEERQRAALAGLAAREELLHRELLASAIEAGLTPAATLADMTARESVLAEALEKAARREALVRERDALRASHDVALREERHADETRRGHETRHASLTSELTACLSSRCFPPGLPPQAALALWRDASALRQRWQDVGAEEAALVVDEDACEGVITRLRTLAAELFPGTELPLDGGSPPPQRALGNGPRLSRSSPEVESLALRVSSALDAAREQEAERRTVVERHRELREEKARLDELSRAEEAALASLLAEGGGGDEESFRRHARQARRATELTHHARELAHRIEARTGLSDTEARESLRALGGEAGLRVSLEQLRASHTQAQAKARELLTEQGATGNQLEQWENDDLLARLRIQEETLRAKVAELATRYAEDKLALALLGQARRRFEEEQQPRVVQLASEHFTLLTAGRYRRVFIPAGDERELRVSDGQRDWTAAQLSRGTREQLYLAFRLAVVRDFSETRGALPLIVDDVLVNFDPLRARAAIHLLAQLSEHQQVIAFTCHPWLRALFEAEGARLQHLETRDTPSALRAG
ncbi:AAA family ATPase [Myxococcus landrumensis]|uniref:AAA family ATPase n=1 Tax=Myxococcus landrumensis TaxID=2813577 RepID=A0ABX7N054_9BACT|nr:AAA family ATPase [Myxococcus landrumus]QSQ11833.1 AAA family ATPase [Myxococcus landrumus]